MLQLGVVGVGQHFSRYRDVLRRLRNPVEIDAVYDCVFARAETVADREDVVWESGLGGLARRHSVDAVLLLAPGWNQVAGLRCLARGGKPVFVAPWLNGSASDFECLHEAAMAHGASLMPALWRRYVPATVRIQELIATELGQVSAIEVSIRTANSAESLAEPLVGWLDFCRNLFRTFPVKSQIDASGASDGSPRGDASDDRPASADAHSSVKLIVDYPATASATDVSAGQATLTLNFSDGTSALEALQTTVGKPLECGPSIGDVPNSSGDSGDGDLHPVRISCERGWAEIRSASEVTWQAADKAVESEKLTADRSEHDIMLDLFCRRVAGGLVPVPDFFDVSHALRIIEQALSDFVLD